MSSPPRHSPRILVAEDEPAMRTALADCLAAEGYRVLLAANGADALETATAQKPDLVLLDVMMPAADGMSVCRALRRADISIPVLMLTARGRVEDRVAGLDAGADDYLPKPFSTAELLARIRALLRRGESRESIPEILTLGDCRIDFRRRTAERAGARIHLTPKEFAMLELLAGARGEVVGRDRFLDAVWGYSAFPTTRTVDNHVARLRAKLEPEPAHPGWIHTVHGIGYRLDLPPD